MSMILKEIGDFTVNAFHKDNFTTVTKNDILGKWAVFFFYPADFTFVCPTELEDLQEKYQEFQALGCEIMRYPQTRTLFIRLGRMRQSELKSCSTRCLQIQLMRCALILMF